MNRVTVGTECQADVTETWTWKVPDEAAEKVAALHARDLDAVMAVIGQHPGTRGSWMRG